MKIFFTGASSFSGFWFCKTLAEHGYEITATFTRVSVDAYPEVGFARKRVEMVQDYVRPVWNTRMGDANFFQALETEQWDAVCLHGAYVADHKAADFPVLKAVEANTNGLPKLVDYLAENGSPPIIWTGTYFEANEGKGTEPLRNFSPYALSKQLSWEYACFYAEQAGVPIGKFVMPNPFGPWEGKGFTSYLARTWLGDGVATVQTPNYIRDNIPVSLLAKAYERWVGSLVPEPTLCPSGYISSQGEFAQRFAREMSKQWQMDCPFSLKKQSNFPEPLERCNLDAVIGIDPGWDEALFWSELADWYRKYFV